MLHFHYCLVPSTFMILMLAIVVHAFCLSMTELGVSKWAQFIALVFRSCGAAHNSMSLHVTSNRPIRYLLFARRFMEAWYSQSLRNEEPPIARAISHGCPESGQQKLPTEQVILGLPLPDWEGRNVHPSWNIEPINIDGRIQDLINREGTVCI